MNSHSFSKTTRALAAGVLSALMAVAPVFAQGHGGGGGGRMGGGGGGHFSGGGHAMGGGHFGGAPRGYAGGGARSFTGPRAFSGPRNFVGGGGRVVGAQHIAPRVGVAAGMHGVPRASAGWTGHSGGWTGHPGGWTGRTGWNGRPGWGHGGYSGHYWGGGVWGGSYWPRVSYGWGFPLFLAALPLAYSTYYWGGIPYYYANDAYYTWDTGQNGYVVTDPPPVAGTADDSSGADNSGQPAQSNDVYAYPQKGQSEEQQSNDRYECHTWARSQTGYDPTHPSVEQQGVGDYQRAMKACLDARGYSAQ